MSLRNRFDVAFRFYEPFANTHHIRIDNEIRDDLTSPLMFPAELTTVFSNLLSNALKAADDEGRILATGRLDENGSTIVRVENTGIAVDLGAGEEWFEPYASSSESPDSRLGQGMGLGLTITRAMLAEYGAKIQFVKPSRGLSTAVEIRFPSSRK